MNSWANYSALQQFAICWLCWISHNKLMMIESLLQQWGRFLFNLEQSPYFAVWLLHSKLLFLFMYNSIVTLILEYDGILIIIYCNNDLFILKNIFFLINSIVISLIVYFTKILFKIYSLFSCCLKKSNTCYHIFSLALYAISFSFLVHQYQ